MPEPAVELAKPVGQLSPPRWKATGVAAAFLFLVTFALTFWARWSDNVQPCESYAGATATPEATSVVGYWPSAIRLGRPVCMRVTHLEKVTNGSVLRLYLDGLRLTQSTG